MKLAFGEWLSAARADTKLIVDSRVRRDPFAKRVPT